MQARMLLALLGMALPSAAAMAADHELDALFAKIPHCRFEWSAAEGISERAAMKLPVTLDGEEGWFQLDTGLDVSLLYGELGDERGWETQEDQVRAPSFEIGGMRLGPTWFHTREDTGDGGELKGSLGLDLLVGRLVLIDYPGRRLALMTHGQAPAWLWRRATWTPAALRDAKLFLYVQIGGESVPDLFFDTGTSAFDVTVDLESWRELTGLDGPDDAERRWQVNSWGKTVTALGAPAKGPLVIGSARIDEPTIYFLQEQPSLFANWPFPATGLVGNAPFWDRVALLDLGIRPRFGLLQ